MYCMYEYANTKIYSKEMSYKLRCCNSTQSLYKTSWGMANSTCISNHPSFHFSISITK